MRGRMSIFGACIKYRVIAIIERVFLLKLKESRHFQALSTGKEKSALCLCDCNPTTRISIRRAP